MVNNWLTLDPQKAQVLIDELIAVLPRRRLLQGDLYSKGGLDQPDQERALAVWHAQAEQGSTAAWYRMATVYSRGRPSATTRSRPTPMRASPWTWAKPVPAACCAGWTRPCPRMKSNAPWPRATTC
jgi:hypothetical protein